MQSDYRPFERSTDKSSLVLQIAVGVFIGILAAAAVLWAGFELRLRWEAQQVAAALQEQGRQVQRELDLSKERDRQRAVSDQAAKDQAIRAAAEDQRLAEDRKREAQAEATRRQTAWARFYKPSPGCALAGQSIECSNEFIRAKRSFDQKYSDGAL